MKIKKNPLLTIYSGFSSLLMFLPSNVFAQAVPPPDRSCKESVLGFLDFPTWYKYIIDPSGGTAECRLNPDLLGNIPKVLLAIFEIILRVGGLVAVGFIIFGGFQYMLSQGNPDQTKGARSTIINALIGLAISISSVAIVNLIGKNL